MLGWQDFLQWPYADKLYIIMDLQLVCRGQEKPLTIEPALTVVELRKRIGVLFDIPQEQLLVWFHGEHNQRIVIEHQLEQVGSLGLPHDCRLQVKDLGRQIRWDLVFYIEYLGPILIIPTFYLLGKRDKYQLVHHAAALMGVAHFVKRELETRLVHVFSHKTMPFSRVFINSAHYWVLFGLLNSIELFLFPRSMKWDSNDIVILFIVWAFMEFLNLKCHLELSGLRKNDRKGRGIPKDWGFRYVSCANYLWESLGWLVFSIMTRCYSSFAFTAVSIAQMASWALKKHKAYRTEFKQQYPKQRKAMIPFLL